MSNCFPTNVTGPWKYAVPLAGRCCKPGVQGRNKPTFQSDAHLGNCRSAKRVDDKQLDEAMVKALGIKMAGHRLP